jgi:hypothetical protein
MGATPKSPRLRLPLSLKEVSSAVKLHIQQITTIQTNVKALQPGAWELLTLANGWVNIPGYIPAQVRILGAGQAQIVGHVENGTTTDGTVIGTVGGGYFNPVHNHAFTANVLAGASSVSNAVSQANLSGSILIPQGNQTVTGTVSGSSCSILFGPSGHQFEPVLTDDTASISGQSTNVNYNTPTLTMNTSGQLVLTNCSSAAQQLSFSEPLPLVTA